MAVGMRISHPEQMKPVTGFVYYLRCPDSDAIRYVGASVSVVARYGSHLGDGEACLRRSDGIGSRKECWIASLLKVGKFPVLHVVAEEPIEFLRASERSHYDACLKSGCKLTNSTPPADNVKYGQQKRLESLRTARLLEQAQ
jgi:hypothetical protein